MELNQEALGAACSAFASSRGVTRSRVESAIEAYLAEMFKPGQIQMLEPLKTIPQRDYRKELWIAHWAAIDGKTTFEHAVFGAQTAVEAFDKFFSEPTHG